MLPIRQTTHLWPSRNCCTGTVRIALPLADLNRSATERQPKQSPPRQKTKRRQHATRGEEARTIDRWASSMALSLFSLIIKHNVHPAAGNKQFRGLHRTTRGNNAYSPLHHPNTHTRTQKDSSAVSPITPAAPRRRHDDATAPHHAASSAAPSSPSAVSEVLLVSRLPPRAQRWPNGRECSVLACSLSSLGKTSHATRPTIAS